MNPVVPKKSKERSRIDLVHSYLDAGLSVHSVIKIKPLCASQASILTLTLTLTRNGHPNGVRRREIDTKIQCHICE